MQPIPTPIPADKSPAQRAQLKLYEQLAAVFLLNAAIAALTLYASYASSSAPNWTVFFTSITATGLLALFNTLEKYFSAKNEPLFSDLVEAGRQEVLSRIPPVQLSAQDQALQTAVNTVLQPTNIASAYVPSKQQTPIILPTPPRQA
jgi:hypothetical protein